MRFQNYGRYRFDVVTLSYSTDDIHPHTCIYTVRDRNSAMIVFAEIIPHTSQEERYGTVLYAGEA